MIAWFGLLFLACGRRADPTPPEGMVFIPGGEVVVGSPRVGPQPPPGGGPLVRDRRPVRISPFFMDRTEVTRAAYARFLADTGYRLPSVGERWADAGWSWTGVEDGARDPDHPVVLLSWYDAREYCRWRGARLPTDAEWELAALGPSGQSWPWGEDWRPLALNHGAPDDPFTDDSDGYAWTSPVGAFPEGQSPYGLEDAFGNAWEWTADAWGGPWADFGAPGPDGRIADPHTEGPALYRGARGGSYFFGFLVNLDGERNGFLAELRRKSSGLRCAADVAPQTPG